jgi:N,N'-diacetyllegionaminate synthase
MTRNAAKPDYQNANTDIKETQYEMLKSLELSYESFRVIKDYCDKKQIIFMSTADEIDSASFLNTIQDIFKVGSAELTDWPFLRKIAGFNKPVILSSGMATLGETESAIKVLTAAGLPRASIAVLHCCTEYPAPFNEINLKAIQTIKNALQVRVGFSDHTIGIEAAIAAVALGAEIIEKHFTLDQEMIGPDHKSSINPEEMKNLVFAIRNIESAMGSGIKQPSSSEQKNIPFIRKTIMAKRRIDAGEIFSEENIAVKRPALGLSPIYWDLIIGKKAGKSYEPEEPIEIL